MSFVANPFAKDGTCCYLVRAISFEILSWVRRMPALSCNASSISRRILFGDSQIPHKRLIFGVGKEDPPHESPPIQLFGIYRLGEGLGA